MTTEATGSFQPRPPKVFISYNRADRDWAEWIGRVLEQSGYAPFMQAWHILPGMNFGVEMHKAAAESDFTIAVLSESFLKSEFTQPEWVAAFVQDPTGRKRKLIPVRVAPCEPQGILAAVVYVDLVDLDEEKAQRALVDGLKPTGKPAGPIPFPAWKGMATSTANPYPPSLGRLSFVPELPPHYVPRPDALAGVKELVLGKGPTRVAITGHGQAVGVQGMGGIGKSVLAAAVAREPDVRRKFPDGVVWLGIGQEPNLIEAQGKLLRFLTGTIPEAATVTECADAVRHALEGREVLIVLDDVWVPDHAALFRGVPEGCRVLVTTRNQEVLTGMEAQEFQVDLLGSKESLVLLADWSGLKPEALPGEAAEIVRECGRLPLAIAAIGAMVRLGPTAWRDALTRLRRADLVKVRKAFPEYPYPHLLRALEVGVDGLPAEERERYLDLAVFPEDVAIPEAPLRLLWQLDELDTRDAMRRFAARSLVGLAESACGLSVRLHDLQRDLIRKRRERELLALHHRLLARYGGLCRGTDSARTAARGARGARAGAQFPMPWHRGPNDGYFFQHLPWHLKEAGREAELRELLLQFDWLQAKLEATDVVGLVGDYESVTRDANLALIQGAIRLSAHVIGQDKRQLASQLVGRLGSELEPAVRQFVNQAADWRGGAWLRPLNTNLHPPGTALLRTLMGHTGMVRAVALNADGRLAVSGSDDQTLKVWDLESGRELRTLQGHAGPVYAVALGADGRVAVSASDDGTLKVWDLESGRELLTLQGHAGPVYAVALSADGRVAVSGSLDKTLRVWDLDSGQELRMFQCLGGPVNAVALSADGRRAVSGSLDIMLEVWDLDSGRQLRTLVGHNELVWAVALSADGRVAVSGSGDKTLKVWDLESGRQLRTLLGPADRVCAVALSANGRVAVSGSLDKTLKVWDLESGRDLQTLLGHTGAVRAVALCANGRRAVSASDDGTLKVWDLESGRELRTHQGHDKAVNAVAMSNNGRVAVSGSGDKTLKVWHLESGRTLRTLKGHGDAVNAVALCAEGQRAVSGSEDGTLKVWHLESGRTLLTLKGHAAKVTSVALRADGRVAVSGSFDGTLKVWDLRHAHELQTLKGHRAWVYAVALSADGRVAVSGADALALKVWDLESGRELRTFEGHTRGVYAVALSADGRVAASGSGDNTLKVWDLESGRELRTFEGHTSMVNAVALSADGRVAVSGSRGRTVKAWDLGSGEAIATFTGDGGILCLALASDGRTIVAGEESGRVHFLRLVLPDDPLDEVESKEQPGARRSKRPPANIVTKRRAGARKPAKSNRVAAPRRPSNRRKRPL